MGRTVSGNVERGLSKITPGQAVMGNRRTKVGMFALWTGQDAVI